MKVPDPRLFTLGTGATPPLLTGREREQAVLRRCLADLLRGATPPHDTDKTVLLNRFKRACRDRATELGVAAPLVEILARRPG